MSQNRFIDLTILNIEKELSNLIINNDNKYTNTI